MAGVEEWHQERPRQRVAQAWALLATAATVVDVLHAGCAGGANSRAPRSGSLAGRCSLVPAGLHHFPATHGPSCGPCNHGRDHGDRGAHSKAT